MDAILVTTVILFLMILRLSRRAYYIFPLFPRRHGQVVEDVVTTGYHPQLECQQWKHQRRETVSGRADSSLEVVLDGCGSIKGSQIEEDVDVSDTKPVFFHGATHISEKQTVPIDLEFKEHVCLALINMAKITTRKNILAKTVKQVVSSYIDYLTSVTGKLADIRTMTNISTCNVIYSIIFGHRFDYDDKEFKHLRAHLNSMAVDQKSVSLINYNSWLKYLPDDLFMAKKITLNAQVALGLLKKFISVKRRTNLDFNDAENFMEAYFAEINKNVDVGESTYMADESLTNSLNELFGAGIETRSTSIPWCGIQIPSITYLQDMACREIKKHLWPVQPSNMQYKTKLRRLNSTITETQELTDITPLSSHQTCSENTTVREHSIPKESHEILDVDSALFNKKIRDSDDVTLKPEELLIVRKIQDWKELIPCITGQRVALGETKSKIELSLFFSNVFQRF